MRVEPELVDGVVAHHPFADEFGDCADPLGGLRRRVFGCRGARDGATPMVDLADDGGDLLGRSAPAAVRKQRGMSTRVFGARRSSAPLSRRSARIRVQRNDFGFGLARHVVTFSPPDLKYLF